MGEGGERRCRQRNVKASCLEGRLGFGQAREVGRGVGGLGSGAGQ